jgi:serine/threonine protein kinase
MSERSFQLTDITFTRVADMFLAEVNNGGPASVERYAQAFPHLSEEIRQEFPTLLMLERTVGKKKKNASSKAPKLLGGCEILEVIGSGAMGIVYRAYEREFDRKVAVKVIPLHGADAGRLIERFDLERRAMARLDHPNIVPVYNYGHDNKFAYLVMKLIDGKSVDQLLEGNNDYKFQIYFAALNEDWAELARLGASVASGLHHAHEQGLIHRDIKPANLVLDSTGKVWITDFGLAKVYDYARSLSRTGEAIGTPRYMAPEQLRGLCDPRSDVYSLGITLYEIAANERAWDEKSIVSLTSKRDTLKLPDVREKNPQIPEHLARIIMKACEFAPEDRYPTAKELEIVLRRFMEGITPSDRRRRKREPDEVFRKRSRRKKMLTLVCLPPVMMLAAYGAHHLQANQSGEQAVAPVTPVARKSTTNFIEKLAETKKDDLGTVVTDFIRDAVEESGDEFHLAEDEKSAIVRQVDQAVDHMRTAYRDELPERTFLEGFHETSLPVAAKILTLMRIVDKSSLTAGEKSAAHASLRHFARAVVNRSIPGDQALAFIATLTPGTTITTAEIDRIAIPTNDLRAWLSSLAVRLKNFPRDAVGDLKIDDQIEEAVKRMMTRNPKDRGN